ncbi:armadillo-type protein, partial [Fimicolochytrium jonesii]|uniref:armadillo-type protein n=1 Tax=Fimicolochytrium jonesii TaxID=1396493 RepID=UPI0022FDD5DC
MEKELDTKEFESEEEKALFIGAMFRAMDGKECIVAADPDCSRVVEKMLRSADDFRVRVFTDRLNGQFIELFKHQFASHVCQTLIYAAADVVDREIKGTFVVEAPEGDEAALETLPTMTTLVEQLCEQMKGEWKDLMMDAYASHLVRAVLCLLSGDPLAQGEAERRSKKSKKYNSEHNNTWKPNPANAPKTGRAGVSVKRTVPPQFKEALKEITREVAEQMEIMGLRTYATHIVANPVLQLLISLSDTSESLISTLLAVEDSATCQLSTQTDEERQFMVDLIRHPVGSHLVEKLLAAASAHLFHQLYVTYFRGQLEELCLHPVANFVVQQLICHTRNGTQLEVLLDELIPFFPTLFTHRRPGVVVKVAEACVKHQTGKCQKEVVKAVANALKATAPEQRKQLVNLILCLKPYGALGEAAKADTNGSLILQNLLLFDEDANKMVIDSFMSLTPEESRNWAFSPTSSRVLEQFLLSSTINLKAKRKLIRSWLGKFATLAADKFGSHTVDKAWAVADIGLKEKIAEDLYNHTKTLQNSHFGKFVLRNCKIETYGKRREEWVERQ